MTTETAWQRYSRILSFLVRTRATEIIAPFRRRAWLARYAARVRGEGLTGAAQRGQGEPGSAQPYGLERCDVVYISLPHRSDRREMLVPELEKLGLTNASHFEAFRESNGALGCALSHAGVAGAHLGSDRYLMVCEDDIRFTVGRDEVDSIVEEFAQNPHLDVLLLNYDLWQPAHKISGALGITNDGALAGCYIVKPHALPLLHSYFRKSARLLGQGKSIRVGAVDILWQRAQQKELFFAVPHTVVARQRSSHSDIVGRFVDLGDG